MKKEIENGPLIYPMPVLMVSTYNEDGSVNVMNAAWGMAVESDLIGISMSPQHKTIINLNKTKAFVISMATSSLIKEADYFGMVSGNDVPNKFEISGLHSHKAELVNAPIIDEFPVAIECEYAGSDDNGVIYGKIKKVWAEENVLNEEGKVDITKVDGVLFDSNTGRYFKIGDFLANAFENTKL